jgi:hypothetical protein
MSDLLGTMRRQQSIIKRLEFTSPQMYVLLSPWTEPPLLMVHSHTTKEKRQQRTPMSQGRYPLPPQSFTFPPFRRNQYAPKRRTIVQKFLGTNRPPHPHRSFLSSSTPRSQSTETSPHLWWKESTIPPPPPLPQGTIWRATSPRRETQEDSFSPRLGTEDILCCKTETCTTTSRGRTTSTTRRSR